MPASILGDFDNAGIRRKAGDSCRWRSSAGARCGNYGHSAERSRPPVIEVVSGPIASISSRRPNLLDPLGMTTTKFFLTDPAEAGAPTPSTLAQGPSCRNETRLGRDAGWEIRAGGGMVSDDCGFRGPLCGGCC